MPMKPSICSGLRRRSFVRSAAVRSGLDRISLICAGESGGVSCPACVVYMPRRRTMVVMIAIKALVRVIFIGLFPRRSDTLIHTQVQDEPGHGALCTTAPHAAGDR